MPWDEFNSFCQDVFNTKYSFVSINKDATIDEGKNLQKFKSNIYS